MSPFWHCKTEISRVKRMVDQDNLSFFSALSDLLFFSIKRYQENVNGHYMALLGQKSTPMPRLIH